MTTETSTGMFKDFQTGSVFWIMQILLAVSGLMYLSIWGYHAGSLKAIIIATIFSLLIIFGIIFSKFEIFKLELDFLKSCASYTWGFLLFMGIGGFIKIAQGGNFFYAMFSTFQLPKQSLFATISGELPVFWDKYVNTMTIPLSEELFWLIGLPFGLIWMMNSISKTGRMSFMSNPYVQLIVTIIVSSLTFAIFHVGNSALLVFMISAMVFRTILIVFVYGDMRFDWFPGIAILPSFALGAHQANNIMAEGLMNFIVVMKSEMFGIFVLLLLMIIIIIGILESVDQFIPGFDIGKND